MRRYKPLRNVALLRQYMARTWGGVHHFVLTLTHARRISSPRDVWRDALRFSDRGGSAHPVSTMSLPLRWHRTLQPMLH